MTGAIVEGASAALAHRVAPEAVPDARASERVIPVDQTNVSVVVADAVIVKWLRPPVAVPHRGVTIAAHLGAVGFTETPRFFGAEIDDGRVIATVTEYVAGSQDGWEWYVDELTTELLDGDHASTGIAVAARLGGLAARLHVALARPSPHLPDPVGRAGTADEHRRAVAVLDAAIACADGPVADVLHDRLDRIRAAIDPIAELGDVTVQHLHGDLHVGQILRRGDDLYVIDFDGNPLDDVSAAQATDASGRRSAMVDLASLVQSVDHVGRVVAKRQPHLVDAVAGFVTAATAATVDAYAAVAPVDPPLLDGLRVVQELHELVYAATHLPRWSYVPEAALQALFP